MVKYYLLIFKLDLYIEIYDTNKQHIWTTQRLQHSFITSDFDLLNSTFIAQNPELRTYCFSTTGS